MVFLFNIIPALIALIGLGFIYYFQFKKKNFKGVVWSLIVCLGLLYLYQAVQPNYLPKGKAPVMQRTEIYSTTPEPVIQDRLLKPELTPEESSEKLNNLLDYRSRVREVLENNDANNQ